MEMLLCTKTSVQVSRFQLRFQQHVYKTSCHPQGACSRRDKLVDCCRRGVQSVEHLPQGFHLCGVLVTESLVESDSQTKV